MELPKLDRNQPNRINANPGDHLHFWDPPFGAAERQNLTLQDRSGNDVLTVYGLTNNQLADLYLDIAAVLGKPSEPTLHHLKQIHEAVGKLVDAAKSKKEEGRPDCFPDETF